MSIYIRFRDMLVLYSKHTFYCECHRYTINKNWFMENHDLVFCHFPQTLFETGLKHTMLPHIFTVLQWRHNDHDSVSNHQPHGCLLNRLFRRRSKKTSKLRVTGLCVGNSPGPVNSPHKGPVTRKMFPFDDVIMDQTLIYLDWLCSNHILGGNIVNLWQI